MKTRSAKEQAGNLPKTHGTIVTRSKRRSCNISKGAETDISFYELPMQTRSRGAANAKTKSTVATKETIFKTPTKASKKARFSDPGPSTSTSQECATPVIIDLTSGLTPSFNRAVLNTVKSKKTLRTPSTSRLGQRAHSLPTKKSQSEVDGLRDGPASSPTFSAEFTFRPDIVNLDDRPKRCATPGKTTPKQNIVEAMRNLERQQNSIIAAKEEEIKSLRAFLETACRQQMRDELDGEVAADQSFEIISTLETCADALEVRELPTETDAQVESQACHQINPSDTNAQVESQACHQINSPHVEAPQNDQIEVTQTPLAGGSMNEEVVPGTPAMNADSMSRGDADADADAAAQLKASLDFECRQTFEIIQQGFDKAFPCENIMSIAANDFNTLLGKMMEKLQHLKIKARVAEYKANSHAQAESAMQNRHASVLEQLDRARKHSNGMAKDLDKYRSEAIVTKRKIEELQTQLDESMTKINSLNSDLENKERIIARYRQEMSDFEENLNHMEFNPGTDVDAADNGFNDFPAENAVQGHGRMPTNGVAPAQAPRGERLQNANDAAGPAGEINHDDAQAERHAREVGRLHVQIGQLSADLETAAVERNRIARIIEHSNRQYNQPPYPGVTACFNMIGVLQEQLATMVGGPPQWSHQRQWAHQRQRTQLRSFETDQLGGLLTPAMLAYHDALAAELRIPPHGGDHISGHVEIARGAAARAGLASARNNGAATQGYRGEGVRVVRPGGFHAYQAVDNSVIMRDG